MEINLIYLTHSGNISALSPPVFCPLRLVESTNLPFTFHFAQSSQLSYISFALNSVLEAG